MDCVPVCRADLANLVNEAALLAGRQSKVMVEKMDFIQAVERSIAVCHYLLIVGDLLPFTAHLTLCCVACFGQLIVVTFAFSKLILDNYAPVSFSIMSFICA